MSHFPLMVDMEVGKASYGFPALQTLAEQVGAVSLYVDEEHDLFMLCKHPITGEVDHHSVAELLNPQAVKTPPKLAQV